MTSSFQRTEAERRGGVLLDIFSSYFLVVSWLWAGCRGVGGGREEHHHRWCSRAAPLDWSACTGLTTLPIVSLSTKVSSHQTTSDTWWETSDTPAGDTTLTEKSPDQRTEDKMFSKISIYIYFTITSLAGDSLIMEIIYRKFRGGKIFYSAALENILFWGNILFL